MLSAECSEEKVRPPEIKRIISLPKRTLSSGLLVYSIGQGEGGEDIPREVAVINFHGNFFFFATRVDYF